AFGAGTGAKLRVMAMADCYAKDNQISDEWLLRDNGGLVRQLGVTPDEWVRQQMEGGRIFAPYTPANDIEGPYKGRGNDNAWGAKYAGLMGRIMEGELSVIPEQYDRAVNLGLPGNVRAEGHGAADAFWLGLRASFPEAVFTVHHQIGREDPMMPPRAALRWSLHGVHGGWGAFGAPTGREVFVMGISHAEFGPWGLRREWVLYDECAIWAQILAP
ncbi:MAG: nuclear transport factor 2 family protein, partial [Shimia sp.]